MKGTAVELLRSPGGIIRDYLGGKRLLLYSPAKFLFLIGALVTILMLRYNPYAIVDQGDESVMSILAVYIPVFYKWYDAAFQNFWVFAAEYNTLLNALSVPTFSLYSYIFFVKKKYNYTENVILNIYIVSIQLLAAVPFILTLEFDATNVFKNEILTVFTLFSFAYNIWAYVCFFGISFTSFLLSLAVNACSYATHVALMHLLYLALLAMQLTT